jgi:hypothetical protein
MEFAVVIVLVSVGLAFVMYRAVAAPSVRRAFARLPVTAAVDVARPGVYRLSGTVKPIGQAPVSQASGRPYVARDMRIVPTDGDSGSERAAQQAVDFLLDDGTAVTLIRAQDAVLAIDRDFEAERTTLDQVPWIDALLRAGGYRNGSPTTCDIRFWEGVLAPGDHAGVVGHVEPADDDAAALGATLVLRPEAGAPVTIRAEPSQSP